MKSEERHQLLQNDLSVVTEKTVGFFERHLGTLIAVVCAVVVVGALGFWWTNPSNSENAPGWTMLDAATNLEEFEGVVDKFKGKPPGQWAQLQVSEKTLQTAIPLMFTNREIALKDLKRCREGFESLVQDKSAAAVIRERALWGLALSLETGCEGDTSKPVEAYERLIADFPDSIFKAVAEERIQTLKKKRATEFYAWFSKEKPKPPEAHPRDVKPGGIELPAPKNPDDLDDEDMEFESTLPHKSKAAPDEKGEKPAASPEKKTGDEPQTETETPESKKSNEPDKPEKDPEKPVEGDKPSENDKK